MELYLKGLLAGGALAVYAVDFWPKGSTLSSCLL